MTLQHVWLISLDAMRGFTFAAMILVNFPGSWDKVYPPLLHASWNGIISTDFIFPFFLFIVGVSIVLAYHKRLELGSTPQALVQKIIIRSVKIYAVGMFLNLIPDFDLGALRWTGVLHRIAVVFFVCALLYLFTSWQTQGLLACLLLIGYWLAMTLIPTPGWAR